MDDPQAVGQRLLAPVREPELRVAVCGGQPRAVHGSLRHLPVRRGMDFEHVRAVREVLGSNRANVLRGRLLGPCQHPLVVRRIGREHFVPSEDVRLPAETADPLGSADEPRLAIHLGPRELLAHGPALDKPGEFLVERRLDRCQVPTGLRRALEHHLAPDLLRADVGAGAGRDLVLVHEALVESRALARRQHVGGDIQQHRFPRAPLGHVPDLHHPGLRHAVLDRLALLARPPGDPGAVPRDGRASGNAAEVMLDEVAGLSGRDVARDGDDRVRGSVVGAKPLMHVIEGGGVQILHLADHGPRVGVAVGVGVLGDQVVRDRVGLVLPLALLVLHDPALLVQLGLVHGTQHVAHAVGLHPQGQVQGGPGHVLKVVRAVLVGGAVEVRRADALHGLEVVVVEVLRAVEHQVLEQVREARLARLLVLRADVIPDVHRDDRRLVVLVDDQGEAVVENELLVRDVDLRDQGARKQAHKARNRQQMHRDELQVHCEFHGTQTGGRDNPATRLPLPGGAGDGREAAQIQVCHASARPRRVKAMCRPCGATRPAWDRSMA